MTLGQSSNSKLEQEYTELWRNDSLGSNGDRESIKSSIFIFLHDSIIFSKSEVLLNLGLPNEIKDDTYEYWLTSKYQLDSLIKIQDVLMIHFVNDTIFDIGGKIR